MRFSATELWHNPASGFRRRPRSTPRADANSQHLEHSARPVRQHARGAALGRALKPASILNKKTRRPPVDGRRGRKNDRNRRRIRGTRRQTTRALRARSSRLPAEAREDTRRTQRDARRRGGAAPRAARVEPPAAPENEAATTAGRRGCRRAPRGPALAHQGRGPPRGRRRLRVPAADGRDGGPRARAAASAPASEDARSPSRKSGRRAPACASSRTPSRCTATLRRSPGRRTRATASRAGSVHLDDAHWWRASASTRRRRRLRRSPRACEGLLDAGKARSSFFFFDAARRASRRRSRPFDGGVRILRAPDADGQIGALDELERLERLVTSGPKTDRAALADRARAAFWRQMPVWSWSSRSKSSPS